MVIRPISFLVLLLLLGTVAALATTLGGVTAGGLAAGSAPISPCDPDGFDFTYTTASGNVTAVEVNGIADPACEGGVLSLTLVDDSGTNVGDGGPQAVPTDGDTTDNSMSVSIDPQPDALQVAGVHLTISGP